MKAIVNFRVVQQGMYWLRKGQRRGYWRVLLVHKDGKNRYSIGTKNVIKCLLPTREGISNVTSKSKYYIEDQRRKCEKFAEEYNAHLGSIT